jgi:murein DD-endopeptidase MepM/ murein hydrolase activator NlpD
MFAFLSHLLRNTPVTLTVLVVDENSLEDPIQYQVKPKQLRWLSVAAVSVPALLVALIFAFTPIMELIPGRSIDDVRRSARTTALRMTNLEDSMTVMHQYVAQLTTLLNGDDFTDPSSDPVTAGPMVLEGDDELIDPDLQSEDWTDHEQPALSLESMPAVETSMISFIDPAQATRGNLSSLRLPFLAPVADGIMTRGFSAQAGHYAVDIAVQEGTAVRSVGDGRVIFADWTYSAGYVIGVYHAGGYITLYKHNKRLDKKVGDQVREREAIAISGNSGEITSGPHLHFELWHEGLAQDPQRFFLN